MIVRATTCLCTYQCTVGDAPTEEASKELDRLEKTRLFRLEALKMNEDFKRSSMMVSSYAVKTSAEPR